MAKLEQALQLCEASPLCCVLCQTSQFRRHWKMVMVVGGSMRLCGGYLCWGYLCGGGVFGFSIFVEGRWEKFCRIFLQVVEERWYLCGCHWIWFIVLHPSPIMPIGVFPVPAVVPITEWGQTHGCPWHRGNIPSLHKAPTATTAAADPEHAVSVWGCYHEHQKTLASHWLYSLTEHRKKTLGTVWDVFKF